VNTLPELQQSALDAFVDGDAAAFSTCILAGDIPRASRIAVYRNNFHETVRKCLCNAYPVVERLVGTNCFRGLAARYAQRHRSTNADLQFFGRLFPKFLEAQYTDTKFAYLADVARLEWAIELALTAPRSREVELDALAGIPPSAQPGLRFPRRPGASLLESPYPILEIWRANQADGTGTASLAAGPNRLGIKRGDAAADIVSLDEDAFTLASCLAAGDSLGAAATTLAERPGFDLGVSLNTLFLNGWLGEHSLSEGDEHDR